jgi:hypothetical protein
MVKMKERRHGEENRTARSSAGPDVLPGNATALAAGLEKWYGSVCAAAYTGRCSVECLVSWYGIPSQRSGAPAKRCAPAVKSGALFLMRG